MAPVKPSTQERRRRAGSVVLHLLNSTYLLNNAGRADPLAADALSEVKGLFTRCCKQDQWDWFTVWTQLGRPGRKSCRKISNDLALLRRAVLNNDVSNASRVCRRIIAAGAVSAIQRFLNPPLDECFKDDAIGYIYIMSTRSNPLLLKIGYTERTVELRVKEINRATGVLEPYGVRAVWVVHNAPHVERAVHEALAEYRVRPDREFFELSYGTAFKKVEEIVQHSRREL